ncbi:MAG: proton-conducting transporter membrane subunit [Pseudomonadota bacterium]
METTILFAPLLAALIARFGWRVMGDLAVRVIALALSLLAAALAWVVYVAFDGELERVLLWRFLETGTLSAEWSIRIDDVSVLFLVLITSVSALVHAYMLSYEVPDRFFKEPGRYRARFSAGLSLMTFALLVLISADDLLQLVAGWGAVSFATYLVVGFYHKKPIAKAAAARSFIIGRIGDASLLAAAALVFFTADALRFDDIFDSAAELSLQMVPFLGAQLSVAEALGALLLIAAMAASAQIFFHSWLIEAGETPAPALALITGVGTAAAGVFILMQMEPVLSRAPSVESALAFIGGLTAAFFGSLMIVEKDINRLLCCAAGVQFGFIFAAIGGGAATAAISHLILHACVIALLFLSAGSVVQSMNSARNLTKYGGLKTRLPWTFWAMVIGAISLSGFAIPGVGIGFVSKSDSVASLWHAGMSASAALLIFAALLSSFGIWRLIFITFLGEPHGDKQVHEEANESVVLILIPLGAFALGMMCLGLGWLAPPNAGTAAPSEALPISAEVSFMASVILGFAAAAWLYLVRPGAAAAWAARQQSLSHFLTSGWYLDTVYDALLLHPIKTSGTFLQDRLERALTAEKLGELLSSLIDPLGRRMMQRSLGYVLIYGISILLGVLVVVVWMIATGGSA